MIGKQININQDLLGKIQPVRNIRKIEMSFFRETAMVGGGRMESVQVDSNLKLIEKTEKEMKVKIISPVVNIPSFLHIQISKFKENLLSDFELICIDDSKFERDDFDNVEFVDINLFTRENVDEILGKVLESQKYEKYKV